MDPAILFLCLTVLVAQSNGAINTDTTVPTYYETFSPLALTPSRGPSSSCVLPQYTHNVNYTTLDCLRGLSTQCPPQPGTDVTEGYVLRFTCREGYQLDDGKNTHAHVSCIDGNWYPAIPKCREICGKKSASWALTGEPWYVLVKTEAATSRPYCLGTLISPHIVLTGAYCVTDDSTTVVARPYQVSVDVSNGNLNWEDEEDGEYIENVEVSVDVSNGNLNWEADEDGKYIENVEVRAISVAPHFYGTRTLNAYNLALLDLKESLTAMPACIDWHHQVALTPGNGLTMNIWLKNGTESTALSRIELVYVNPGDCVFGALYGIRPLVTPDKMCAGDRTAIHYRDPGYSGAGLTFESNGLHYVMGVASDGLVNDRYGTQLIFTNVSKCEILTWIKDTKRTFEEYHMNSRK